MIFILSYILHHANRSTKGPRFYAIKDKLLKQFGLLEGHDIQHIPGKLCRSCGGTGDYTKYSMYPPYEAYDWDTCWYCNGDGFFKLPQWNCLARIKFGPFTFHRPLKRELMVKNPWTVDGMGFKVSDRPIIEGYIEHKESPVGTIALFILYYKYDRGALSDLIKEIKGDLRWKRIRLRNRLSNFSVGKLFFLINQSDLAKR